MFDNFDIDRFLEKIMTFKNLAFLLLFMFILSCFVIIKTGQVGIRVTLGVVDDDVMLEGFHLKIPFLNVIDKVSLMQHQENFTQKHTQTKDMQLVSVPYKVIYSITPQQALLNRKEVKGDIFEVIIKPRAGESIMDALAKYSAEDLITNRNLISTLVKDRLNERVQGHAIIHDVAIQDFDFENKEFILAVQRKVIAKQDAQAAEIRKQQSQAEADQAIIRAKGNAESIRIEANALKQNKDILALRQIEILEKKWDGKLPETLVLGKDNTNLILNPTHSGK